MTRPNSPQAYHIPFWDFFSLCSFRYLNILITKRVQLAQVSKCSPERRPWVAESALFRVVAGLSPDLTLNPVDSSERLAQAVRLGLRLPRLLQRQQRCPRFAVDAIFTICNC